MSDLIPIDRLPVATTPLAGTERLVLQQGAVNGGKTVKAVLTDLPGQNLQFGVEYHQPTTGNTINGTSGNTDCIIDPAGELATLTVNVPASGTYFHICTTQLLDALTVGAQGGASISGGSVPNLNANGGVGYVYRAANTTWYRIY